MPHHKRAVVFGLDGARGDLIAKAVREGHAPNLALIPSIVPCDSCSGMCARPQDGPKTLDLKGAKWKTTPGWTSVLTGVNNDKHCVIDNTLESVLRSWDATKAYPSFLGYSGVSTPLAVGRPTVIGTQDKAGILDPYKQHLMWNAEPVSSGHVGEVRNVDFVLDCMQERDPDVLFIHLDGIDQSGHKYGWGSREQWHAIGQVDHEVGRVLSALDFTSCDTLLMVTADHGGHDKEHGLVEGTDSCVPFLTNATLGPVSRKRLDDGIEPRQFDVCTTVCSFMGFPTDGQDGHDWFL